MTEHLTLLILSYRNLGVQHENLHNYSQALLFYQIAEDLHEKNKTKFSLQINHMIDDFYKFRLVNKASGEKSENIDKIGTYFNKTYLNIIIRSIEERTAKIDFKEQDKNIIQNEEKIENDEQNQEHKSKFDENK